MGAHYGHLSFRERLAIFDGRYRELGVREIARQLGRSPSTLSREPALYPATGPDPLR